MQHLRATGPFDEASGLWFEDYVVTATNRSGDATGIGELVMFDLAQSATEVDNSTPGSSDADGSNSAYNNYINPSIAAGQRAYIFGIALEAIADNATGSIQVRGRCTAKVAAATVAGSLLVGNADGEMDIAAGTGDSKVLAIAEGADTANQAPVLFDGLAGFGWDVTT